MNDDLLIQAVLIPPQLERFRQITGVGDALLQADFTGWHKHVILASDRVFLFPRHLEHFAIVEREAEVYAALSGLPFSVPHLIARYHDAAVSPYPFIAVTRLRGVRYGSLDSELAPEEVEGFLVGLARLIAEWHNLDTAALPPILHRPATDEPLPWKDRALLPANLAAAAPEMQDKIRDHLSSTEDKDRFGGLLTTESLGIWIAALGELAAMKPVLVHGDVHEDQLLVTGRHDLAISGILDWETARIDHPVHDFDFGQWGNGLWAWEARFALLRRAMWEAYAAGRSAPMPHWSRLHLYFSLRELAWVLDSLQRGEQAPEPLQSPAYRLARLEEATALCRGG